MAKAIRIRTGGTSGNPNLPMDMTTAERNLWGLMSAFEPSNAALWLEAGAAQDISHSGFTSGAGPADAAASFLWQERLGRGFQVRDVAGKPIWCLAPDGRPSIMFGMGTTASTAHTGDLIPAAGSTQDLLKPGGWTIAWSMLLPILGSTFNVTLGDNSVISVTAPAAPTNFGIIGSQSANTSAGLAFNIYFNSTGKLIINNASTHDMWGQGAYAHNYWDGVRHDMVAVYDPVAKLLNVYDNGVLIGTISGNLATYDIQTSDPLIAKPRIGAAGVATNVNITPQGGFISKILMTPTTDGNDATKRGYFQAQLAA